jgi:hypothetical protein
MTDHPLDRYDDTDMTLEGFDRAFERAEVVEQRPPAVRVEGVQDWTEPKHGIRLADSSVAVTTWTESRHAINFADSSVTVEATTEKTTSAIALGRPGDSAAS